MRAIEIVLILFLFTQLISLGVGVLLIEGAKTNPALSAFNIAPDDPSSVSNSLYLIISILIGAGLIFVLLLLPFRSYLILLVEFVAAVFSSFIVFFVFLSSFNVLHADLISLVLAVLLFVLRLLIISLRNLVAVIAGAGIGAVIAFSIDPLPLFLFVVLLSIYDILAVKWTKHMVRFAEYFMKEKTSFSIGFEGIREMRVKEKGKIVKKEEPWRIELGTGDVAVASMLCVSAYKIGGLVLPTVSMLSSTLGLYLAFLFSAKRKEIVPALPFIVGSAILGMLLTLGILALIGF
ncbi:MAG: presenilin family intramembrane aspartyl protease [Candidatus Micrarchaeota archaeon]|nr:presenilin family intramembrane aspartyl protease [Candidatus Micrarchaeota archaeon]